MSFQWLWVKAITASAGLLSASAQWLATHGAKAVTGPLKDVTGAANDLMNARKARIDAQLAQLNLADRQSRIVKPSTAEIEKYGKSLIVILLSAFLAGSIVEACHAQARASPAAIAQATMALLVLKMLSILMNSDPRKENYIGHYAESS